MPEERLVDILRPNNVDCIPNPLEEAKKLLQSNERLQQAARNAKSICIAMGPICNQELAAGLARIHLDNLPKEPQQSRAILLTLDGPNLDSNTPTEVRVLRHDPALSPTTSLSSFKGGFPVGLNSEFMTADFRIIIGELRTHQFLKYSGLSDVAFPGLASESSIQSHLSNRPNFTTFDLGRERVAISESLNDTFFLGLVIDASAQVAQLAVGTIGDCLANLEARVQEICVKEISKPADIVVMSAGGVPFDETLLRAVETFPAGLTALKRNGILIVAAECGGGHGDTEFYEWAREHKEPRHLDARLRHRFNYNGYKASFLGRILQSHRVYLVSTIPDYYVENIFGMRAAPTVNAALQTAQRTEGSDSTISVIPDASRILPRLKEVAKSSEYAKI